MEVSEKKTLQFVRKVVAVTGALAAIEISAKLITGLVSVL